jgi:hypothetical protein
MILEFVFLPLGVASVLAVQHTLADTLSLLRHEDSVGVTCSTRREAQHSYTVLVGKCEGRGPCSVKIYRGQSYAVMDARKTEC